MHVLVPFYAHIKSFLLDQQKQCAGDGLDRQSPLGGFSLYSVHRVAILAYYNSIEVYSSNYT